MSTPLESLVACGTRLWLDSIDPELVVQNKQFGATGATSNPIIVADLIKSGRFDSQLSQLLDQGLNNAEIAWELTDQLVRNAQVEFAESWHNSDGDDGYVSFELDPLLEDASTTLVHSQKVEGYLNLGKRWSEGHKNRMIKVPATPAGLEALEDLAAAGVTLNVTLLFTARQYQAAREAIWRGAQRRESLDDFKSVYSIFISRIDVYTKKNCTNLSEDAQGQVGIINAKRLWQDNQEFWGDKQTRLSQEIIFASTGTKDPSEPADKYVSALAGSDIQTNPPATNAAIQEMQGKTFSRTVDQMPPQELLDEIDQKVDMQKLEDLLMEEGLQKFSEPQKALIRLIAEKRQSLATAS